MKHRNRAQLRRSILVPLVILAAAASQACVPRVETTSRIPITAEVLDRIDAAMERRALGHWPSWSMEVTGGQLAFQVEVAQESAAEVCGGIREVVHLVGDDIVWSADLTRDGLPLTRCGTLSLLARGERAPRVNAPS